MPIRMSLLLISFIFSSAILSGCAAEDPPPDPGPAAPAVTADTPAPAIEQPPAEPIPDPSAQQASESPPVSNKLATTKGEVYEALRQKVKESPFEVELQRVYLSGSCPQGGRPKADGIAVVVDGQLTYRGDDLLYDAVLGGQFVLRLSETRYVEAGVDEPAIVDGRVWQPSTKFTRSVSGSDPWKQGQSRRFHWESVPINPVFCQVLPESVEAFVSLRTEGVRQGPREHAIHVVDLQWDEVAGMAIRQPVKLLVRQGNATVEQPADALYSKRDRVLVTQLNGQTRWVKRSSIVQQGPLLRAPAAVFPVEAKSEQWLVRVTGIAQLEEYGGYAPKNDEQVLAAVDLQFQSLAVDDESGATRRLKGTKLRLESSSTSWQTPAAKATGQLDMFADIKPGDTLSGTVVFPKHRYDRPFRLEVRTTDKTTLYLDVFTYNLGTKKKI